MGLHSFLRRIVLLPAFGLAFSAAPAFAQPTPGEIRVEAKTVPSASRDLALRVMDVVAKVFVKPGDPVKAGDPLIVEDTREEEVNLEILQLEADVIGDLIINAAEVTLENKKVELRRVTQFVGEGGGAKSELEKATLEVELAGLDLKKATQDRQKKLLEVKLQRQRIARMQINSPIDGFVQKIEVEEGEVIDPQRPAITIVRNDPLWVEARVPTRRAIALKLGQQLDVYYKNEPDARKAEIIYFDPVAIAGANFQIVRLAMPNPDNRPSGMMVDVVVPAEAGAPAAAAPGTTANGNASASAGSR
jgi:RND family efflux transporter MFP subunit